MKDFTGCYQVAGTLIGTPLTGGIPLYMILQEALTLAGRNGEVTAICRVKRPQISDR